MQKIIDKSATRGGADHGWLTAKHTFSFGEYYNPKRMGFGKLRVLNDDIIQPAKGFPTHGHQNMEIVTIPLSGALEHKDSMGNSSVIRSGEVQIMSAGTGVMHSEYNASQTELVNLLQIWVLPEKNNIEPRYEQKKFDVRQRQNAFQTVVSPSKDSDSVWINQNSYFSLCSLEKNKEILYKVHDVSHGTYLFIIKGSLEINGDFFEKRDGIGVWETNEIQMKASDTAEILAIEIPLL